MTVALSCLYSPGPVAVGDSPTGPTCRSIPTRGAGEKGADTQCGRCRPSALRVSCCLSPASAPSDATGFNRTGGSSDHPQHRAFPEETLRQVFPTLSLQSGGHNSCSTLDLPWWPEQLRGSSEFPKGDVAMLSTALQI